MSLINLTADLSDIADSLRRIAKCLELLLPPLYPPRDTKKEYPIEVATNEATYEYEINDQLEWFKDHAEIIMREYGDKVDGS